LGIKTTSKAPPDWDTYVAGHPSASAYHRAAAVSLGAAVFGLRVSFICARDADGRLQGVLPLVEQSSVLFGRFLVSVPFFTYGGILADTDRTAVELAAQAASMARSRRAAHVELRHLAPISGLEYAERTDKVSMVLPLPGSEADLAKQLGSKLRSQIRRAEREQPDITWGGAELLPEFYRIFASSMHDLGTPVYPRRFFDAVWSALSSSASVLVVRAGGEVQAAAILVRHGRRMEVPWAAASPAAKRGALNMRMYWELLRRSLESGADAFDFGRSTVDSGTYRFKAQWGAQPMQLYWHYWLPEGAAIPKLNAANPKYALASACWRRLPLWCANWLGPHISRSLP
jgi:serine/alanine adding enzyme